MCVYICVITQYPLVSIVGVWGYARNWIKKNQHSRKGLLVAIFAPTDVWLMPMDVWRMEEAVLEKIQDTQWEADWWSCFFYVFSDASKFQIVGGHHRIGLGP